MKKRILFTAAALVCAANLTAQCLGVGSSTSGMSPEEMAAAAKAGVEYVEIGISGRGTVAEIREKRAPEPYKGKGIRYKGEHVNRKEGKKAAK